MKSSKLLVEEALLTSRIKTLYSLTESDIKDLDKDLTPEEVTALMESFYEDPQLMLEFLGTIAGLGGKAAKFMSSKFSGASKSLGKLGKKATNFSNQRALKGERNKARKAHTAAVKAYGKSLKSNDPKARKSALAAMVTARNNSRMSRGKSFNLGTTPKGNPKTARGKYASDPRTRNNMYKRLGECLVDLIGDKLNEDK